MVQGRFCTQSYQTSGKVNYFCFLNRYDVNLQDKTSAFATLGLFLRQFTAPDPVRAKGLEDLNALYFDRFEETLKRTAYENGWFTPEFLRDALRGIVKLLDAEALQRWTAAYPRLEKEPDQPVKVGVVMAGNIPMVGFHDFLAVLLSGHFLQAKTSSRDSLLIPLCFEVLTGIEPRFSERAVFTSDQLEKCGAVIATGSNNSSRYFEYYFRDIPSIIRKNRNSVAIIRGDETDDELFGIGRDVFTYFGLGCRNVTKIYIPENFPPERLMNTFDRFSGLAQHHKYANNVDYHRSVFLMNSIPFLDNGAVLLKEDPALSSPVGVVYYEKYADIAHLAGELERMHDELQCVVSVIPELKGLAPGSTQTPLPWDYADGVDTLKFLTALQG